MFEKAWIPVSWSTFLGYPLSLPLLKDGRLGFAAHHDGARDPNSLQDPSICVDA